VQLYSQDRSKIVNKPDYYSLTYLVGVPIKNHPNFPEVNNAHIVNVSAYFKQNDNWCNYYSKPRLGVYVMQGYLGSSIFGNFVALYPSWEWASVATKKSMFNIQ